MTKLTPDELKTLEQVAASGLQGKWSHIIGYGIGAAGHGCPKPLDNEGEINVDQRKAIESVNALPRLLAHIRTLEADLDAARNDARFGELVRQDLAKMVGSTSETHGLDYTTILGARLERLEKDLDAARREARAARHYIDEGVAVECNRTPGDTATTADIADEYRAARAANPMESKS